MARLFARASSEYITLSSLPAITSSVSISAWYYNNTVPGAVPTRQWILISEFAAAAILNYGVYLDSTGINLQYTTASGVYVTFTTTTTFDTGHWHHVLISSDFTTAGTKIYLDGVSQSFSTGGTPGTPQTTGATPLYFIGRLSAGGTQEYFDGRQADVALWTAQLSAIEALALSAGIRPYNIRRSSLADYWPLDGLQSPEPDLSGNVLNGTLTGTARAFGPPFTMFTPLWAQPLVPPPPLTLMPQIVM